MWTITTTIINKLYFPKEKSEQLLWKQKLRLRTTDGTVFIIVFIMIMSITRGTVIVSTGNAPPPQHNMPSSYHIMENEGCESKGVDRCLSSGTLIPAPPRPKRIVICFFFLFGLWNFLSPYLWYTRNHNKYNIKNIGTKKKKTGTSCRGGKITRDL